jgi:hypothetical protein
MGAVILISVYVLIIVVLIIISEIAYDGKERLGFGLGVLFAVSIGIFHVKTSIGSRNRVTPSDFGLNNWVDTTEVVHITI